MLWRRPLPLTLLKGTRTAGPLLLRSCLGPSCSAWTITGMHRSLRVPNTITCTWEGEVRHVEGGGKRQGWLCSTRYTFPFLGCPSAALSLTGPPAEIGIGQLLFRSLGYPYKTKHSSQGHLFSKGKQGSQGLRKLCKAAWTEAESTDVSSKQANSSCPPSRNQVARIASVKDVWSR